MKSRMNSTANGVRAAFIAPTALVLIAFALVFIAVFAVTHPGVVTSQKPDRNSPRVENDLRNRRLLELNEGVAPTPTRVRFDRDKRLLELNEGYAATPTAVRVTRNSRLLELNEGYVPTPVQSPRDQRLYFLNR